MATRKGLYNNLGTGETDAQSVSVYDQTATTPAATRARIYSKGVAGVAKMHAQSSDGTEIGLGSGSQTLTQ